MLMLKQLKYIYDSITFKVIVIIIILVLPLNILSIDATQRSKHEIIQQTKLSLQNVVDTYMTQLNSRMENADYFMFDLRNNDTNCLILLSGKGNDQYKSAKIRLANKLNTQMELYDRVSTYYFYINRIKDKLVCTNNIGITNTRILKDYINDPENLTPQLKWTIVELNGVKWLFRKAAYQNVNFGSAINLNQILTEINDDIHYKDYDISFDKAPININDGDSVNVTVTSDRANLYLNISVNKQEVLQGISLTRRGLTILAFIYLLLIPALFWSLRRMLIKPIENVYKAHNQLEAGNQDYRIAATGNTTEFKQVYHSFNQMADNIVNLKIENMEKEIAKQKMELKNLQLQIRPHFLLNTFNLIYTLAQRKNIESIQDLILYLSDYFRYLFRSGNELEPFSHELRLIKGYLDAAAIRYPESFYVEFDISPEVESVRVPPLLIHNFVENIINHALKYKEITNIKLKGKYEAGMVVFQIIDDGNGMNEEEVDQLNQDGLTGEKENAHVGIHNSITRLKYFYGDDASILVSSKLGEGACFTVKIPYK